MSTLIAAGVATGHVSVTSSLPICLGGFTQVAAREIPGGSLLPVAALALKRYFIASR